MRKKYLIGHAGIELHMADDVEIPSNLSKFEVNRCEVQKKFEIAFTDCLEEIEKSFRKEHCIQKELMRKNMRILISHNQEFRIIYFEGAPAPYAISLEDSESRTKAWVSRKMQDMLKHDTVFASLLGLEKVMLCNKALILHSAYISKDGKAILFSAPSETGKSTQASLWERYRQAKVVNGDRALLVREQDGWHAHGWPICGNSGIGHNESYPIRAIVMLNQATENQIQPLGLFSAMKKLMSEITINMWNPEFQVQAMDLIQQLAMEVPVYQLGCNISEDAVRCLERVLE